MHDSDNDSRDFSSDEEENILFPDKRAVRNDVFSGKLEEHTDDQHTDDEQSDGDEDEEKTYGIYNDPTERGIEIEDVHPNASNNESSENQEGKSISDEAELERRKQEKLKSIKKFKAAKKLKHKTGVIYLSKIPPYMKPAKLRQILSRFGEVDRLFLKREDDQTYKQRVKGGGNKKTMFKEGWAEYIRKKDAKLCAITLNGNIIGGKKGNFYHDDIMNVKYLSGFKWADLTEQIAKENDIRQSKLQLEISQANKLNAEFIRNVEKSKMIKNIKLKRNVDTDEDVRRSFKQRRITSTRTAAPDSQKQEPSKQLDSVIYNLF
ncbi:RNA-binding ATPase activator ESF2 Ecym_7003 [Eremothecium cymbalariae DBVPG|uniref:Pre-rRNA-processing protein ESF2 n=1 Tax=Eremothecium cymbalariae (strain CBS 270.75 / DBVPG 7215 / KCTC 17166 / NRRL Y-17582) TaxID=931890 RepID=G8JVJ7_ERECY|nr:hypothetical protein Ecym_7003 [Eremothecium cymbalariae DBVPG\